MNELGYPLVDSQRNATTPQKAFLFHAYPLFNEIQKKRHDDEHYDPLKDPKFCRTYQSNSKELQSWDQKYLTKLEKKRKELRSQKHE